VKILAVDQKPGALNPTFNKICVFVSCSRQGEVLLSSTVGPTVPPWRIMCWSVWLHRLYVPRYSCQSMSPCLFDACQSWHCDCKITMRFLWLPARCNLQTYDIFWLHLSNSLYNMCNIPLNMCHIKNNILCWDVTCWWVRGLTRLNKIAT